MSKEMRFKNPKAPGTFKQLKAAACHLRDVLAEGIKVDPKTPLGRRNRYQLQGVVYNILKKRLFKPDNKTYVGDPLTMAEMDLFLTCKTFPPYLLMEVKKDMMDKYGWLRHNWYPWEKPLEDIEIPKKEKPVNGNGLYKIEKNIPLPKQKVRRSNSGELAAQMNVGDSVLLSSEAETNKLCSHMYIRKQKACRRVQENGKSWRVWRIE
jgi:hypothetical protein